MLKTSWQIVGSLCRVQKVCCLNLSTEMLQLQLLFLFPTTNELSFHTDVTLIYFRCVRIPMQRIASHAYLHSPRFRCLRALGTRSRIWVIQSNWMVINTNGCTCLCCCCCTHKECQQRNAAGYCTREEGRNAEGRFRCEKSIECTIECTHTHTYIYAKVWCAFKWSTDAPLNAWVDVLKEQVLCQLAWQSVCQSS